MSVQRVCRVCNKEYFADSNRLKHGRQTTCSRLCSYKLRGFFTSQALKGKKQKRRKTKHVYVTVKCVTCLKPIVRTQFRLDSVKYGSFCSRGCKAIAQRSRVIPQAGRHQTVIRTSVCENCGKTCRDHRSAEQQALNSKRTFCSIRCVGEYQRGENNPSWRGGHPRYYGPDWKRIKKLALIRDNRTCRRCGKRSKNNPDVHHIKPVRTFENRNDANTLDNVVCLCRPCHTLVEWHHLDI